MALKKNPYGLPLQALNVKCGRGKLVHAPSVEGTALCRSPGQIRPTRSQRVTCGRCIKLVNMARDQQRPVGERAGVQRTFPRRVTDTEGVQPPPIPHYMVKGGREGIHVANVPERSAVPQGAYWTLGPPHQPTQSDAEVEYLPVGANAPYRPVDPPKPRRH